MSIRYRFLTFLRRPPPIAFIDIEQVERQRAIREAEWQQELDRQSRVMRVSGGAGAQRAHRKVQAIVEWVKRES